MPFTAFFPTLRQGTNKSIVLASRINPLIVQQVSSQQQQPDSQQENLTTNTSSLSSQIEENESIKSNNSFDPNSPQFIDFQDFWIVLL